MWKTILLFIALSPGMLLTLPPVGNKIVRSGKTCLAAAIVHGIIFALLLRWLKIREAFQGPVTSVIGPSSVIMPSMAGSVRLATAGSVGLVRAGSVLTSQPVHPRYQYNRKNYTELLPISTCNAAHNARQDLINKLQREQNNNIDIALTRDNSRNRAIQANETLTQLNREKSTIDTRISTALKQFTDSESSFNNLENSLSAAASSLDALFNTYKDTMNSNNSTLCPALKDSNGMVINTGTQVFCRGVTGTVGGTAVVDGSNINVKQPGGRISFGYSPSSCSVSVEIKRQPSGSVQIRR